MSNLNGFIKIHRKLIEWGWYSDSAVKDVFIHLLIVAAFKDGTFMGHEIKRGQAVIGFKRLSEDLGLSQQQVRTAIKKLESTGEITRFSTNKFSIVNVENYEDYQCEDKDTNKRITNEQQTNNKRITNEQQHLKNVKNVKNVKNIYISKNAQKIADKYNTICKSLPRCTKLTDGRLKTLKARMDDYTEEDFETLFAKAEASSFLKGNETWKGANFDWLINPNNMIKVLEGNYDDKQQPKKKYTY